MRRGWALLFGIYITCISYSLLTLVYGSKGYRQYAELEAYKERLEKNVEELEIFHNELALHAKELTTSRDAVILAARELGYLSGREGRIEIGGSRSATGQAYQVGTFLKPFKPSEKSSAIPAAMSVIAGLTAAIAGIGLFEDKKEQ